MAVYFNSMPFSGLNLHFTHVIYDIAYLYSCQFLALLLFLLMLIHDLCLNLHSCHFLPLFTFLLISLLGHCSDLYSSLFMDFAYSIFLPVLGFCLQHALGPKEIDGLLVLPGKAYTLLTDHLGSVVQSIVSLTISLRHKFVKQISAKVTNTLLFFVEKM